MKGFSWVGCFNPQPDNSSTVAESACFSFAVIECLVRFSVLLIRALGACDTVKYY